MSTVNGSISFWHTQMDSSTTRDVLVGPTSVDVCIVGAGLTGLWTAYYLKIAAPQLSVAVIEQRCVGFGASGRNGGWLNAAVAGSLETYAKRRGVESARALQRAMLDTVDEVISVALREGIDADIVRGGVLRVARTPAQLTRLERSARNADYWGDSQRMLNKQQTEQRIVVDGALGGLFSTFGARVHPAKLVAGLADVVSALGVRIYESTLVTKIDPHRVETSAGPVLAGVIVRATEGFTASFRDLRRFLIPMNSSMIVTEPLDDAVWDKIGWSGDELLGDSAHTFMYAQRTNDNRVALGGRGVPYRYASKFDHEGCTPDVTIGELRAVLVSLFPVLRDVEIAHAWSGVLGVPRDWCASVTFDRATGLAAAGGYVGHGLSATNLAGRTLRDLILERDTLLTGLPWVEWRARSWEPEPLRWLGVRSLYLAYRIADRREASQRRSTSKFARWADLVAGR